MSVSELNHFMTYVLEGWMLFSAGFVSFGFISFAARRIQEDLAAEALALTQTESAPESVIQGVSEGTDFTIEAAKESARLEEVAAVSEQLAKTKGKQSDTSSVSVST